MRKRCRRKVYDLINPITHAISGASITPAADLDRLRLLELSAIESFAKGAASREDWRALADMVNLTEVMAIDFGIAPEASQHAEAAQAALLRSYQRAKEGKTLLLDGPGLEAIRECFAWHDAQRSSVARSVYERAIKATADKVSGRAPGVKVMV